MLTLLHSRGWTQTQNADIRLHCITLVRQNIWRIWLHVSQSAHQSTKIYTHSQLVHFSNEPVYEQLSIAVITTLDKVCKQVFFLKPPLGLLSLNNLTRESCWLPWNLVPLCRSSWIMSPRHRWVHTDSTSPELSTNGCVSVRASSVSMQLSLEIPAQ